MGRLQQVAAGVRVGEAPDAQAVGRVQLAEEELAAGIAYAVQLQQTGGREQGLGGRGGKVREQDLQMPVLLE